MSQINKISLQLCWARSLGPGLWCLEVSELRESESAGGASRVHRSTVLRRCEARVFAERALRGLDRRRLLLPRLLARFRFALAERRA